MLLLKRNPGEDPKACVASKPDCEVSLGLAQPKSSTKWRIAQNNVLVRSSHVSRSAVRQYAREIKGIMTPERHALRGEQNNPCAIRILHGQLPASVFMI